MKKQNKVMVGALALLVMGTSSLAYFTDRTESNFNAKAGNLCLTHVDSQSDLLNMAPGDLRDISFEYKNEGTLAMDTRVTYMLSYELEDGKFGNTEGKVVTLLDGEDELVTKEIGEGVAKVTVNEATIQGTVDKVGEASLKKNLKLKLHESVVNDFQDATFHIDVVIEGKQNKNDAQWEEINTEKITVRADELNVVRQSACNADAVQLKSFAFSEDVLSYFGDDLHNEDIALNVFLTSDKSGKVTVSEFITPADLMNFDLTTLDLSAFSDGDGRIQAEMTLVNDRDWMSGTAEKYDSVEELKAAIHSGDTVFTFSWYDIADEAE